MKPRRSQRTSRFLRKAMLPDIIHSTSTDPFFNHALEEYLLRHFNRRSPLLFTCTNADGIVIGRNQVPWLECDMTAVKHAGLTLSRRVSGGGTVYQDFGNANFGLVAPRKIYDPTRHLKLAARTLAEFGLNAEINEQRSLFCEARKLSGSAFMLTTAATIQHATMLIDADLTTLRSVLSPSPPPIDSAAVASVPAHVANLTDFRPGTTRQHFYDALREEFARHLDCSPVPEIVTPDSPWCKQPGFKELYAKYTSPDWILGRTPKFSYTLAANPCTVRFETSNGRITGIQCPTLPALAENLYPHLGSQYFDPYAIRTVLVQTLDPPLASQLAQTLTEDFHLASNKYPPAPVKSS